MPYANKARQRLYQNTWDKWNNRKKKQGAGARPPSYGHPRVRIYASWSPTTMATIDSLLDETLALISLDLANIRAQVSQKVPLSTASAKQLVSYAQTLVLLRGDQLTTAEAEKERLAKLSPEEIEAEMKAELAKVKAPK